MFSIITATFNAQAELRRTRDSLSAQVFANFEWVVIDAGSDNPTKEIMSGDCPANTVWRREADRGIAHAWNKGLAIAQQRQILILNAGDTYDPNALEVFREHVSESKIVCAHARVVDESGRFIRLYRAEPKKLSRGMHVPHNWCCVPASFYKSMGGYRELAFGMDFDWFHKFFRRYGPESFTVLGAALGDYHLGGISDRNYFRSFRCNEQILVENGSSPMFARACRLGYSAKHALAKLFHP